MTPTPSHIPNLTKLNSIREYTPSQQTKEFFGNSELQEKTIQHLTSQKMSLELARKEIDNSNMRLDGKLVDILESQLSIIDRQNASNGQEKDHTLTLKVADELVRIQKNLARMDSKTKGLKQLSASVARIGDNFSSNGYEIVDMMFMDDIHITCDVCDGKRFRGETGGGPDDAALACLGGSPRAVRQ